MRFSSARLTGWLLTATSAPPPFDAWRVARFTQAELANDAISGRHADPDGDGIPNSVEYGLNLDPKTPGSTGLPTKGVSDPIGGKTYLTLTFKRWPNTTPISYIVETGDTPESFTAGGVQLSAMPNADGTETVTVRDTKPIEDNSARFMRLRLTDTP